MYQVLGKCLSCLSDNDGTVYTLNIYIYILNKYINIYILNKVFINLSLGIGLVATVNQYRRIDNIRIIVNLQLHL
jgi:hypothetical protein